MTSERKTLRIMSLILGVLVFLILIVARVLRPTGFLLGVAVTLWTIALVITLISHLPQGKKKEEEKQKDA